MERPAEPMAHAVTVADQGTWTLVPAGDYAFDINGLSGFHFRFARVDGEVVRMIGSQPGATFAAERVEVVSSHAALFFLTMLLTPSQHSRLARIS